MSGMIYDGIASAQLSLLPDEQKDGGIVVDIGGTFTKVSIFKHNCLHRTAVIPIGGDLITKDVSHCLETSVPEAERLKIVYGNMMLMRVDKTEEISINTKNGRKNIKKLKLCQIIEARIKETIKWINNIIPLEFDAPYKVALSGSATQLTGLVEYISKQISIPVRERMISEREQLIENADYNTAIGLVLYALKTKAIGEKIEEDNEKKQGLANWWKKLFV